MSRGTSDSARSLKVSNTGLSPSLAGFPNTILLPAKSLGAVHNPGLHAIRFRLFPFRSPLLWKSIFSFSSSGYLDVSVHRVPSAWLCIHHAVTGVFPVRFPHSDIYGSLDICS